MKLYLVRHGESEANHTQKTTPMHQGNMDTPLTELGREQARLIAERLKDEEFEAIYTTPLMRAYQTAEIIGEFHDNELIVEERLRERSHGDFAGKPKTTHKYEDIEGHPLDIKAPNGESYREHITRVGEAFKEVLGKNQDSLMVIHGKTIRAILHILHNYDATKIMTTRMFKIPNTSLFAYELEGKEIKTLIDNCHKHLAKLYDK